MIGSDVLIAWLGAACAGTSPGTIPTTTCPGLPMLPHFADRFADGTSLPSIDALQDYFNIAFYSTAVPPPVPTPTPTPSSGNDVLYLSPS